MDSKLLAISLLSLEVEDRIDEQFHNAQVSASNYF